MAVPKRKTSVSKRNMRRSHHSLNNINIVFDKNSGEPPEGWPRWAFYVLGSLGLGAIGGLVFSWLTIPLPWMIGAMTFSTLAALTGLPVRGSNRIRSIVVPVLGIMLGSSFSPETIGQVSMWIPSIIVMLIFTIMFSFVLIIIFDCLMQL